MEYYAHGRTHSSDLEVKHLLIVAQDAFKTVILGETPFRLAPGQSRPLAFRLSMLNPNVRKVTLTIDFKINGYPQLLSQGLISHTFHEYSVYEPHKITYLHPGGIVSYAILRAPSRNAARGSPEQALPVILNMHGAGLEADSQQVRHMLDPVPDLPGWVLFPTGVTPWSGDDWRILLQDNITGPLC